MRTALSLVTMGLAAAVASPSIGLAQTATLRTARPAAVTPAGARDSAMVYNDNLFATAAAAAGMAEVASARMAAERGGCDEVKAFAKHMIEDHGKANQALAALAGAKGVPLPSVLQVSDQAGAQNLAALSGEEFDHCYIEQQIAAHICAVGLFEGEVKNGNDPEMKALAAKLLPTLKEHKEMLMKMHKEEKEKSKAAAG